jgi:O-antigen/teichoic acid export membrane protein
MEKRRIVGNAVSATGQVIITGVSLFILYRYLLDTIGVEQVGIWSIVLATSSVSRIGELGLSGSVTKFVAKYCARDELVVSGHIVQTAALTIAGFLAGVLAISYPILSWALGFIFPDHTLMEARILLPYALASLWITSVAAVFQSGLDGCLRTDLRSLVIIFSNLLFLLAAFVFVPMYGLLGLAWSQILQALVVLLTSWLLLRHNLSALPIIPYQWHRSLFREMLSYGINFQINSIAMMLFEPVTKALLGKFGDLAMAGYYEMAQRMIMQFRALLVSANRVLVPVFASLHETDPEKVQTTYRDNYRFLLYLTVPLYAAIIALSPVISELWIGYYQENFVFFTMLLAVSYFLNTLVSPAYFAYLGSGRLRWNTISHVSMGILNGVLSTFLGLSYGGKGVVIGSAIAFACGSSIIIAAYHIENHISIRELAPKGSAFLIIACGVSIAATLGVYYGLATGSLLLRAAGCFSILFLFLVLVLWYHPIRPALTGWVAIGLSQRKIPIS